MPTTPKFSSQAGIAIGPILFVIALLAILAAAMSGGSGDFQVASGADRITADISAQANLIRNTINQCNLSYQLAVSTNAVAPSTDPYPTSDTTNGTTVGSLTCTPMGSTSLWGAVLLPPPTSGFNAWTYMDASASGGGRCFWTTPAQSSPATSSVITTGLAHAATKFNAATVYSATSEVIYTSNATNNPNQKFVVWITMPTGTVNSHCTLP